MTQATKRCEVIMLATPEIDGYARYSRLLWSEYCARNRCQFYHYPDKLVPDMHVNWSKIEMARRHLASSEADIIALVDADTYVCNPDMSLTGLLGEYPQRQMVFAQDTIRRGNLEVPLDLVSAFSHGALRLPNAGFVLMENSKFTKGIFDNWLALARNDLKHLADRHPRNQRVFWRGLYFQNQDKIGLLDGRVRRLQSESQLYRALADGCDVVHVRGGMSKDNVERLRKALAQDRDQ